MTTSKKILMVSLFVNLIFVGFVGGKILSRFLRGNGDLVVKFVEKLPEEKRQLVREQLQELEQKKGQYNQEKHDLRDQIYAVIENESFDSNQYGQLTKRYRELRFQQSEKYASITSLVAQGLSAEERRSFSRYLKSYHRRYRSRKHRDEHRHKKSIESSKERNK